MDMIEAFIGNHMVPVGPGWFQVGIHIDDDGNEHVELEPVVAIREGETTGARRCWQVISTNRFGELELSPEDQTDLVHLPQLTGVPGVLRMTRNGVVEPHRPGWLPEGHVWPPKAPAGFETPTGGDA